MKFSQIPNSNPNETRGQTAGKKKAKLRAIDRGTVYDVPGEMKALARSIDRGEHGEVTDCVVIVRNSDGHIGSFNYGRGNRERAHHMVSTVKNRLEPS